MTLFIVRHGQTDWNVQKKLQGHQDLNLNAKGEEEALQLVEKLKDKPFAACYSSDLLRAYETAAIISSKLNLSLFKDSRLRERNFKELEGRIFEKYDPKEFENARVEAEELFRQRFFESLTEIALHFKDSPVLVVTHGGVMRSFIQEIYSIESDIEINNTALLVADLKEGSWKIMQMEGILIKGEPFGPAFK